MAGDVTHTRSERIMYAAVTVCAIVMLGVSFVTVYNRINAFDPLHYSPTPRHVERVTASGLVVVPTIPGIDGPAVRLGETVPTTGLLCSTAIDPVDVIGDLWWQRSGTSERIQVVKGFPSVIEPGCRSLEFENIIPDEVAERVAEIGTSVWVISGRTTPTAPGGVAAAFTIEPFTIVGGRSETRGDP